MLVVVTSRQDLPASGDAIAPSIVHQLSVGPIGPDALSGLVQAMLGGEGSDVLTKAEVAEMVAACKGSPLLTRLAADAVAHGRLSIAVGRGVKIAVPFANVTDKQHHTRVPMCNASWSITCCPTT